MQPQHLTTKLGHERIKSSPRAKRPPTASDEPENSRGTKTRRSWRTTLVFHGAQRPSTPKKTRATADSWRGRVIHTLSGMLLVEWLGPHRQNVLICTATEAPTYIWEKISNCLVYLAPLRRNPNTPHLSRTASSVFPVVQTNRWVKTRKGGRIDHLQLEDRRVWPKGRLRGLWRPLLPYLHLYLLVFHSATNDS